VLVQRGDQLAGKVVVGITKDPLNCETFDSLVVPADASTTAKIASSRPQSPVLNTAITDSAASRASGTGGGTGGELPTTRLSGGHDADAKSVLADIVARAGCAPSTPVGRPAPASWKLAASGRSPSPPPPSWRGPAGSVSSADGLPGWHRAPEEGSSWLWYVGMFVLVVTLFALLTLLHRA
jgi:hypothetical protein